MYQPKRKFLCARQDAENLGLILSYPTQPGWPARSLTAFSFPGPSETLVIPGSPPLGISAKSTEAEGPEEGMLC